MLEKLITELGEKLSMTDQITKTEAHHYLLPFENEVQVEAIELEKSLLLKGIIGKHPQSNLEAFLLRIMEANLFGIGTRGAIIGLNNEGKLLTLSAELDYNSSFREFYEKLEDFVSVLIFWREEALKHS